MACIAEAEYVVQRTTRFNGVEYQAGDPAPPADELGNVKRLVSLGLIAAVQPGSTAAMTRAVDTWDPSTATVESALAFVLAHPEQLERIRRAEAEGKARGTLLTDLDGDGPVLVPDPAGDSLPPPSDPNTPSTALRAHLASVQGTLGAPEPSPALTDPLAEQDINPADHNVATVIGWVDRHPDQALDVLEAEQAGRNRVTLVTHLENVLAATTAPVEPPSEETPADVPPPDGVPSDLNTPNPEPVSDGAITHGSTPAQE